VPAGVEKGCPRSSHPLPSASARSAESRSLRAYLGGAAGAREAQDRLGLRTNASYDTTAYRAELERRRSGPAGLVRGSGDVADALHSAAQRVSADYFVPHTRTLRWEVPTAGRACYRRPLRGLGRRPRTRKAPGRSSPRRSGSTRASHLHVTCWRRVGRKSKTRLHRRGSAAVAKARRAGQGEPGPGPTISSTIITTRSCAQHLEAAQDAGGRTTAWLHRTVFPPIEATFQLDVTYAAPANCSRA